MSDYLYLPGSGLEVPGVEAVLEYGDSSLYRHGGIPGRLLLNDRSMPDQVRVTELSGLHDDPDAADSRVERAGHYGERAGILMPRGRTVGVTGHVRAGNVPRMRDLWRRTRGQFARSEQDLLIHPPGEPPFYVNEVASSSLVGWTSNMLATSGTVQPLATFTDGTLVGLEAAVTGTGPSTNGLRLQGPAVAWSGQDLWVSAIVKVHVATVAATSILIAGYFVGISGSVVTPMGAWIATGTGRITSPATGSHYLITARMVAAQTPSSGDLPTHVIPTITLNKPASSGNYTLRAARVSAVLLDADEATPAGHVSANLPGFEWEGVAGRSRSYGPCYAVNQVADPESTTTTTWANDSTSGAVVDTAGDVLYTWPGGGRTSNSWTIRNPSTTARTLALRTSSSSQFVVASGRRYRAHVRLRVDESFSAGALQVFWLDKDGATISSSTVALFDPVAVGGISIDVELDGVVTAPSLAQRAYMRVASTTTSTAVGDRIVLLVADPRFVDVSEYDPGPVAVDAHQDPEHGLGLYLPSRAGGPLGSFVLVPAGARRRIPRPFLLRGIRSLWDGKSPESQRNLLARRDFTMSLRASDPRVYVLDERHVQLQMAGASTMISQPMSTFKTALDQPWTTVASDSFVGTTVGGFLNGRTAPLGGSWATSGDTPDFAFEDNFIGVSDGIEAIFRDNGVVETTGRYAILGSTNYTDSQVDARTRINQSSNTGVEQVVVLRWTDASNHLRLIIVDPGHGSTRVEQVVAGAVTVLATTTDTFPITLSSAYRIRLITLAGGRMIGQILSDAGSLLTEMQATSTALATGGALQTGKPGLKDRSLATLAVTRHYTGFTVSTPVTSPTAPPPNFSHDGTSLDPAVVWKTSELGGPMPLDGVALGPDERFQFGSHYLTADSLARVYYSAGSITYTTPQVTVSGDVIASGGGPSYSYDYNLFTDSWVGGVWQYNYVGVLLKRVSASTWVEVRYNSANQVAMNAAHATPTAPSSLELWCSHNAAGTLATTRLAAWDVPTANIIDGVRKRLRAYMDAAGVVYVELWSDDPNFNDTGLITRQSFAPASGLNAVIGPTVAGRAGMMARLARWDDGSHTGVTDTSMEFNYGSPYLSTFEAIDYSSGAFFLSCPVIGDADDVPLRLQLRGDLDTPAILVDHVESGESHVLSLSGVFPESDPVTIDMDAGTIRSASGVNYFSRRLTGSRFFSLAPGQNVITVQAVGWNASAPVHVVATYRDALK